MQDFHLQYFLLYFTLIFLETKMPTKHLYNSLAVLLSICSYVAS